MARKICKSIMVDKGEYKALFKLLKGNDVKFNEWVRHQIRNELKRHNALPEPTLLKP